MSPDDSSDNSTEYNYYYSENYYGPYYYFYDYPWWLDNPATTISSPRPNRDESGNMPIRNIDGGRNGGSTSPVIAPVRPPSTGTGSSSGDKTNVNKPVENGNVRSSNNNTQNHTRSSKSSNNNVRNNNGNRSSSKSGRR